MNSFILAHLFKITLYGESHQDAIGIVIDGKTQGLKLIREDVEL